MPPLKPHVQQLVVCAEDARDDCYPARVHATLDLLDRHLATMKDQLTPKPLPGRAPPKKVVCTQSIMVWHLQRQQLRAAVLACLCLSLGKAGAAQRSEPPATIHSCHPLGCMAGHPNWRLL